MLVLFRFFLTSLFLWLIVKLSRQAAENLDDDVSNAGLFALAVVVGFAASITWAPVLGRLIAGPMTGLMNDGNVSEDRTWLIRFARRCEAREWPRMAVLAAFAEGVRHPNLPAAFVVGMNNARPGSWLEKVFAREVWRFNNITNCVRAHEILRTRHHIDPGTHEQAEINLALMSQVREPAPPLPPLAVPAAPPAPLPKRNARIRLFGGAPGATPAPGPDPRKEET
jgi:hypothetical protein